MPVSGWIVEEREREGVRMSENDGAKHDVPSCGMVDNSGSGCAICNSVNELLMGIRNRIERFGRQW